MLHLVVIIIAHSINNDRSALNNSGSCTFIGDIRCVSNNNSNCVSNNDNGCAIQVHR